MKHHKSGRGKHRAVKSSAVAAGTFSLLVAATFANGGLAVAAPQPGITGPAPVQPGVTSPARRRRPFLHRRRLFLKRR